jgi:hypothetical protein
MDKDLNQFEFNSMVNINKFHPHKTMPNELNKVKVRHISTFLEHKPISSYYDFPMYFGYYFRETYRNAINDLMKSGLLNSEKLINLMNDPQTLVIENEIFLPDVAKRFEERHQTHVVNSLQGLSYCNSYVRENSECYKERKVKLPFTRCTKLAIFDLDETLIH